MAEKALSSKTASSNSYPACRPESLQASHIRPIFGGCYGGPQ
jgi:hypothetical protein